MTANFSSAGSGGFVSIEHNGPTFADCHKYAELLSKTQKFKDYGQLYFNAKQMSAGELAREIRRLER